MQQIAYFNMQNYFEQKHLLVKMNTKTQVINNSGDFRQKRNACCLTTSFNHYRMELKQQLETKTKSLKY